MVFFSDGYGVSGKFTSNTGASSSKNKSYGYKGKKKKAPKQTKTYMTPVEAVDMSSGGDDNKPTAKEKELFRQQEKTYLTKSSGTAVE